MRKNKILAVVTLVAMLMAIVPVSSFADVGITAGTASRDAGDQNEFGISIILTSDDAGDIAAESSTANLRKFTIAKPDGWIFVDEGDIEGTGDLEGDNDYPSISISDGDLEIILPQAVADEDDTLTITDARLVPDTSSDNYLTPGTYYARIASKSSQVTLEGLNVGDVTGTAVASVVVECVPFWDISGDWTLYLDGDYEDSADIEFVQDTDGDLTGTWTYDPDEFDIDNGEVYCRNVEFTVLEDGGYYTEFEGKISISGNMISGTYENYLGSELQDDGIWVAYGQAEALIELQKIFIDPVSNLELTQEELDDGYLVNVTGWVNFNSSPDPELDEIKLEVRRGSGSWELEDKDGPGLDLDSITLTGRDDQYGREFSLTWEITEAGVYFLRVTASFTPESEYPDESETEGAVIVSLDTPGAKPDGTITGGAAATAIANKILSDAGISHKYFTGEYKGKGKAVYGNYISEVARAMGNGAIFPLYNSSKNIIGYIEKSDADGYYEAVFNYLKYVLGADLD